MIQTYNAAHTKNSKEGWSSLLTDAATNIVLQHAAANAAFSYSHLKHFGAQWEKHGNSGIKQELESLMKKTTPEFQRVILHPLVVSSIQGAYAHCKALDAGALARLSKITHSALELSLQASNNGATLAPQDTYLKGIWQHQMAETGTLSKTWADIAGGQHRSAQSIWDSLMPVKMQNSMIIHIGRNT